MIYVFLADGFEEVEALFPVDVLRRAGFKVVTVAVGNNPVTGAHGIPITADTTIHDVNVTESSLLLLPGGMPGTKHLGDHRVLCDALYRHAQSGGMIAAICAAPSVLGTLGLLTDKRYTCYPGFQSEAFGGVFTGELVCVDTTGAFPLVTGAGPGAAADFSFALLDTLGYPKSKRDALRAAMQFRT